MHCLSGTLAVVWVVPALLAALGQNVSPAAVPVAQEPSHHLVLENRYTRVYRVEVPVKSQTLLHRHDSDYVFVTLGAAEIQNAVQGRPALSQKLSHGDTRYVQGGFAHVAKNLGGTPFRNITIEILKPGPERPWKKTAKRGPGKGPGFQTLVNNSKVKVLDVRLAPQVAIPASRAPRLLVAVSAGDLRLSPAAGTEHLRTGDVRWLPARVVVTNVAGGQGHFVLLEYR